MAKHLDKIFGELKQDPTYDEWTVKLEQIHYTFESLEALPYAHNIVADLASWTKQAKMYAAQEMLERKNTTWPDNDENGNTVMLTAAEFAERMVLQNVDVQNNGALSFWFDDGDLFYGHAILVEYDGKTWHGASIQG